MRTQTKNRACNGKKVFTSKLAAKKRATRWIHAYHCKHCGNFHLGHSGVYRRQS